MEEIAMKRLLNKLVVMLCVVTMAVSFTGCSRVGYCDECEQYEKLSEYVMRSDGERVWVCDYCKGWLKLLGR